MLKRLFAKDLIIWTHHRVLPKGARAAVGQDLLRRQLELSLRKGHVFVDTAGLRDWLDGKLDPFRRHVMLSFDDGWADNLFWATPVLREFGVRAVLALNTGLADLDSPAPPRRGEDYRIVDSKQALAAAAFGADKSSFLTLSELLEMLSSGLWDIQAHGHSHLACYSDVGRPRGFHPDKTHWSLERALGVPPFPGAPRGEFLSDLAAPATALDEALRQALAAAKDDQERLEAIRRHPRPLRPLESSAEFQARLRDNLSTCANLMVEKLGIRPRAFFWPWGHCSAESEAVALELGFDLLLTMDKDTVRPDTPKRHIPRIAAPDSLGKFKKQLLVFSTPLLRRARKLFA